MKTTLPKSSVSPFPGRQPYAEHQSRIFFGRDAESDLVVQGLVKSRLTLLSGPPGVGKTSLLRAGVMPRLRAAASQPGQTPIIIFWDNWQGAQADPLSDLIDEIQRCCVETLAGFAPVRVPRVRALEHVIEYWAAKAPLFIIFDRFEDYLLSYGDEDGEGKFSVEFPRVVKREDLEVNFLLAMRGGAHAKLGRLAQRLPQLFERSLRLKPLGADAARAAIVLPIQAYNREHPELAPVHVDSTLVDYVIRTVAIAGVEAAAGDEIARVDASSLQTTMQELWDAQIGRGTPAEKARGKPRVLRAPALAADAEPELPDAGIGAPDAMPKFGVMADITSRAGAGPDAPPAELDAPPAEMPETAARRWRPGRSGRAFAALAYVFVCAMAVFGGAGWIGQTPGEYDKQQALSVQEKADQALARARETLAKAAQWQAANEQPSREKASGIAEGVGNEAVVAPLVTAAVEPVERLAGTPKEKRSATKNGEAVQRKPEVSATAGRADETPSTNAKPDRAEPPRPSLAMTPDAAPAPAVAAVSKVAAAAPPTPAAAPASNPAAVPASADQAAATGPAAAVPSAIGKIAPAAGKEASAVANSGGSPADQIPAWAKEPAVEAVPAISATVEPINSAPVNSSATAPVAPAPVRAVPIEKRRTTVAVKQEEYTTKNIVQARAKDTSPRPGARTQSFPSNSVIDAARAQSPPSEPPRADPGVSFAAPGGKKAPLRTTSYDKNSGRDAARDDAPSIFIHVRDQSQLAQTMRLKRRLEAKGIVVSGIKTVTRGPDDADLRYFRRNERGEARQMVNLLQSFNVPVEAPKYISGFESTATTRQFELWFPAVN